MLGLFTRIFGTANDRIIKKLRAEVNSINMYEEDLASLSDQELKKKTDYFKDLLSKSKTLDDIAHEAFAVVREASKRVLGLRHFDVQLIGGLILHRGSITEMRTGEGKTLVATLPAYLNALTGKGVHIVTPNDYLANRDAQSMGKVYNFLGLSVGSIVNGMGDFERKDAYNADITYATNNELGFDYLRDNMKFSFEAKVQRPFHYAIVDEVDSILIDEARTPLIISGPVDDNSELYTIIDKMVRTLSSDCYEKDEKSKTINLTEEGINKVEDLMISSGIIKEGSSLFDFENMRLVHFVNQALKSHNMFSIDVDYLVKDGRVMIIDEFTGRVLDGRRYSDGLHQALEAKEGVKIQNENQTLASITFQNYFRLYKKLSGMTGTAMTEAAELKDIYNLEVISVPTHHKAQRIDNDDIIYGTKEEKNTALVNLIKERHEKGQPILVGTISIEKSEEISLLLEKAKIKHHVLNAKNHLREAYIIAQAGRFGAVTIATNMAGRGTDIQLGGNSEMLIDELPQDLSLEERQKHIAKIKNEVEIEKTKVIEAGGLYVIATERHESRRIDNQLRGRSGRQGDPGETKFFLSLQDDLMRIFASDRISGILRTLGLKDGEAIYHPMISRSLEKAQQKVEANNYEIRKNLLKFDDVMNDQRKVIYEQRNDIISAKELSLTLQDLTNQLLDSLIVKFIPPESYRENWDLSALDIEVGRIFGIDCKIEEFSSKDISETVIAKDLSDKLSLFISKKEEYYGSEVFNKALKYIFLSILDQVWKDHLHILDHLRQGISLRAYGQKDPLNEYKREAFALFDQMLDSFTEQVVSASFQFQMDISQTNIDEVSRKRQNAQKTFETRDDPAFSKFNSEGKSIETTLKPKVSHVPAELRDKNDPSTWGKVARNDPCPCGSGKKYKHCHGLIQ
jgi:preprotein translocase subunit SecA